MDIMDQYDKILQLYLKSSNDEKEAYTKAAQYLEREQQIRLASVQQKDGAFPASPQRPPSASAIAAPDSMKSLPHSLVSKFEDMADDLIRHGFCLFANDSQASSGTVLAKELQNCGQVLNIGDMANILEVDSSLVQLSFSDISEFGLNHSPDCLHDEGEVSYQKIFNENNKMNQYLFTTASDYSGAPVFMMHDGRKFNLSGKADNISLLRPMSIEFKGGRYGSTHHGHKDFNNYDWDVLCMK